VVGVLVQTNFGGRLTVGGARLEPPRPPAGEPKDKEDGSCMIVIATDAPLDARNLERLAARAFAGMARTGASFGNGSGDYAIAFSTAEGARGAGPVLANEKMSPLFVAVAEATEEAILNSLFKATPVATQRKRVEALPIDRAVEAWRRGRRGEDR
jgi:D-aminopeptidase